MLYILLYSCIFILLYNILHIYSVYNNIISIGSTTVKQNLIVKCWCFLQNAEEINVSGLTIAIPYEKTTPMIGVIFIAQYNNDGYILLLFLL